jgi:hypothetical protein
MLGRHIIIWFAVVALVAFALPGSASYATVATDAAARPVVTGVHANSGSTSGAAHVIVQGRGFTRASVVRFGGVRAPLVSVESARELTAYAPPGHNGVVHVTVRTANGISAASPVSNYRYVHAQLPAAWNATRPPSPAGYSAALDQNIEGVDCPSTRCYYVAALDTSARHAIPVIGTSDGTAVSETVAPSPNGKPYTYRDPEIGQLTCASATSCVATGVDGRYRGRGPAFLLTLAGGKWTAITAPLPPETPSSTGNEVIEDVSCGAPGRCVAVGYLQEAKQPNPDVVLTLRDGTWTSAFAPNPISSGRRDGTAEVSCASASWCLIASGRHLVVDRSGRFSAESFTYPPVAKGSYLKHDILGLDCPAVSRCTLLIESYSGSPTSNEFLTMRGGRLAYYPITAPADVDAADFQLAAGFVGFSCADANTCLVNLGYPSAGFERQAVVVRLHDGAVRDYPMPQFAGRLSPPVGLNSVGCSSAAACVAIGGRSRRGAYEVFADGVWTPQAIRTAGLSGVRSLAAYEVSCAPSGQCLATGYYFYHRAGAHHPPREASFVVLGSDR